MCGGYWPCGRPAPSRHARTVCAEALGLLQAYGSAPHDPTRRSTDPSELDTRATNAGMRCRGRSHEGVTVLNHRPQSFSLIASCLRPQQRSSLLKKPTIPPNTKMDARKCHTACHERSYRSKHPSFLSAHAALNNPFCSTGSRSGSCDRPRCRRSLWPIHS